MDDLPELPFEQVLSYLSLEDRLKARAVSRRWYHKINSHRVESLCYSRRPAGFILGKSRLVHGVFTRNFISSPQFLSFFNTFGPTILSNLKHLRLCHLDFEQLNRTEFARVLNSLVQLEELGLFGNHNFYSLQQAEPSPDYNLELNLPMLTSIHLEELCEIEKLTVDAPRLRKVKLCRSSLAELVIVHGESIETLLADFFQVIKVTNLKNLKYLLVKWLFGIESTFLSGLDRLQVVHTISPVRELLEQKKRYGRTDLKIYRWGLLLNGRDDTGTRSFPDSLNEEVLVHLAENSSRLADDIPLYDVLEYSPIRSVRPKVTIDIVSRFTDLHQIYTGHVEDIERFLNFLENLNTSVLFFYEDQSQDLFDRLPEHSAVQKLYVFSEVSDFEFLRRLKDLIYLYLECSIDLELIRRLFEELPFLLGIRFKYNSKGALIDTISGWNPSKQFRVAFEPDWQYTNVADLDAAIQLIKKTAVPETD